MANLRLLSDVIESYCPVSRLPRATLTTFLTTIGDRTMLYTVTVNGERIGHVEASSDFQAEQVAREQFSIAAESLVVVTALTTRKNSF